MMMRYWQISKNRSVPPSLQIKVKTEKVKHLCGGWCCLLASFKPCTLYPIKQFPGCWSFYMFYSSAVAGTHYSWIVLLTCFHAHFTYMTSIFTVKPIALPFRNTLSSMPLSLQLWTMCTENGNHHNTKVMLQHGIIKTLWRITASSSG